MPILSAQQSTAAPRSAMAVPSLASDLSWLLLTAASPSVRTCYLEQVNANPPPASMCGGAAMVFDDRPDLAERVRTFWDDQGGETSFTEMHILAHYSGALYATDPDVLWGALERGIATVPLDLDMASESQEELVVFSDRFRLLKESPRWSGRIWGCSRRSGPPSTRCGNSRCRLSRRPADISSRSSRGECHWTYS